MEEILAVTKHSINSNLDKPLDILIDEITKQLSQEEKTLINSIISKLDNSTYGLSALKTILDTVKTNSSYIGAYYSAGTEKTIATLISEDSKISSSRILGSFVAPLNGTVRCTVGIRNDQSSQQSYSLSHSHYIEGIYYSNTAKVSKIEHITKAAGTVIGYNTSTTASFDIDVEQGKRYYIYGEASAVMYVTSAIITANITKVSG